MSELKIWLLGAPRAEVDGRPLDVDTRKALALLAYLAVGEPVHRRDALTGLLWPDHDTESARGALRRTLSSLRKALGGAWIGADRSTVSFDDRGAWIDVREFESLAASDKASQRAASDKASQGAASDKASQVAASSGEDELRAAARLYRGDFMEGFSLRDGIGFEDWQFFRAEELRRTYSSVLERLVGILEARGHTDEALEDARRWLALDPLHEPVHRRLMSLYAAAGRRGDALRQYRECVSVLDRELGVAPLPETSELNERIMRDEVGPRPAPVASARPEKEPIPLVGRAEQWALLSDVLAQRAPSGIFVVIEGEAGVGKTRLAESVAEHVTAAGGTVLRARCYEEGIGLAYAPVVDLLRAAHALSPRWEESLEPGVKAEVARLVPEMRAGDHPQWSGDPGAQGRFLDGLATALVGACSLGPAPGLLLVDDLHWADEASLEVVAYVARRLQGRAGTFLVTWRTEDVPAGHRLRRLVSQLKGEGAATSIVLPRLGRDDCIELAAAAGIGDASEIGARLYEETEGLPLFLAEYLAVIESCEPAEPWTMPDGVREALEARLATLSGLGRQVIGAAAVVGRSFDFDTVRTAGGRSEDETVEGIEELRAAGLIDEVADMYDFDHELVRKFVYEDTGLARRRLLHRRVAEGLARRHRARADGGRSAAMIARHFQLAGRETEAAHYYRVAGEGALAVYANVEALAHLGAALALGSEDPAALRESIGDVQTLLGEYAEAVSSYEAAASELADPRRLPILEHKIGGVHQRRGAYELADSHYRAALDLLDGDDGLAARIHADMSLTLHSDRRDEDALEAARRAEELAEATGDRRALAQTHNILGILWTGLGRPADARSHLEKSLELADEEGDPSARIAALNNLALAARAAGDLDEAIELTGRGLELCVKMGDRHREAALHNNLADLLRAGGRADESMEHLKAAVVIFSEIGPPEDLQPEIWKLVEW